LITKDKLDKQTIQYKEYLNKYESNKLDEIITQKKLVITELKIKLEAVNGN